MMNRSGDDGFSWYAAAENSSSRRAIAFGILAVSCTFLAFIAGRLSAVISPPIATSQTVSSAPVGPRPAPKSKVDEAPTPVSRDSIPKAPATSSQRPPMSVDIEKSEPVKPEAKTPPSVVVINAGSADREARDSTQNIEPQSRRQQDEKPERKATGQTLPSRARLSKQTDPEVADRARDYLDLRRHMLGR